MTVTAPVTSPPLFHSPYGLFACQQEGVAWSYMTGSGLLVADTGIGKSVMAMGLSAMLAEDEAADLVLLVCKQNKLSEWAEDYAALTRLPHRVHHGASRAKRLERDGLPHVLVSTYETLRTDLATFTVPPGRRTKRPEDGPLLTALLNAQINGRRVMVVYDEISDKLRNRGSQSYKAHEYALKRLRTLQPDLRVIGLTATPISKGYEDAFNLLRLIVPRAMPKIGDWEEACIKVRDEYGRPKYRTAGVAAFTELTRPYVWRKRKTDPDVRGMFPAKIEETRKVTMGKEQATLYEAVRALQDGQEQQVPGLRTILRQIAAHPASLAVSARTGDSQLARDLVAALGEERLASIPSAKTEELIEYLRPIIHAQGDKAVVFSFFGPTVLPLLAEALRKEGIRSHLYHGGLTGPERESARRAFRDDPQACVFLTSDAGKDGINLPEASYCIEYECALNHADRTQRFGRIDRAVGSGPSITLTTMVLMDTVEVAIAEGMLRRNEMADDFNGDTGAEGHVGALQRRAAMQLR